MVGKKVAAKTVKKSASNARNKQDLSPRTEPKFPYTNKPASLRRILKEIPNKPKPDKIDKNLLRSWGFNDSNDYSLVRVLKAVDLINDSNQPTERYAHFMHPDDGGKSLGSEVRRVYAPLFQASHTPHTENAEKLKTLFNIHSGGGEATMEFQIGTFKALAENSNLSAEIPAGPNPGAIHPGGREGVIHHQTSGVNQGPVVNINLHIHLPENKTRRDYEDIIEDIGRYIFGRNAGNTHE